MLKKAFYTLVGLAAISGTAWFTYTHGYWRFVTPDPFQYPIMGTDVSHHQGEIDWQQVKGAGIKFAFIKATEGATFVDPDFRKNMEQAQAAGIAASPYHFFTLCRSGVDQAANFLTATNGVNPNLPVVVDLEFVGNCKERPTTEAFQKELNDFLTLLQTRFPKRAIFYTTYGFHGIYLKQGPGNPIWIRDIFFNPSSPNIPNHKYVFWQYADHARLPGIKGPVDLNVYMNTGDMWPAYLQDNNPPQQ